MRHADRFGIIHSMPCISVIIPVYNVEAYLRQCLDSIINQTLRDIEVICVDDGSTDGSASILAEYAAKDSRVKVAVRAHTNAGECRNAGMRLATGEYLGFVDSDDWCDRDLFKKAYAKAKSVDADVVSWRFDAYDMRTRRKGAARVFGDGVLALPNPFSPADLGEGLFSPLTYAPWGRIVRRSLVAEHGIAFQSLERTNDVYFCCMARALSPRQAIVNEVLYTYRVGMSTNLQANNAKSPDSVFEAWSAVSAGLAAVGMSASVRRALISASANSFFYTLNVMSDTEVYCSTYNKLRELYSHDVFFSKATTDDIASAQTATYFKLLKSTDTPLDFLVRQENYYRERLSTEFWSRIGAQKARKSAEDKVKGLESEISKIKSECSALREKNGELAAEVDGQRDANASLSLRLSTLCGLNDELKGMNAELRGMNSELRDGNRELRAANSRLDGEIGRLRCENDSLSARAEAFASRYAALAAEYDEFKSSAAFRAASAVLRPFMPRRRTVTKTAMPEMPHEENDA